MSIYEFCALIVTMILVGIGWYIIQCFRHLAGVAENMQGITQKINTETLELVNRQLEVTESILVQVEQETIPAVSSITKNAAHAVEQVQDITETLSELSNIPALIGKQLKHIMSSWFKKS